MPWITSRHAIRATLEKKVDAVLYLTDEGARNNELTRLARAAGVTTRIVRSDWLRRRAGSSVRGAALEVRSSEHGLAPVVLKDWLSRNSPGLGGPILALDHITDPHNVGAILRSAYLTGVALVIVPARRSTFSGEGVLRSSAGAAESVPIALVANLAAALKECKDAGWWVYAADAGGTPLPEVRFDPAAVIVLGAEGKGVAPAVARVADMVVTIPDVAPPDSTVDSFNVSVAAGIILYEWLRTAGRT